MIHSQYAGKLSLWSPGESCATNNDAVRFFDAKANGCNWSYAQVTVHGPIKNGTQSAVLSALKLVEATASSSTASSSWSDVTEFVGTTSTTLGTNAFTITGPTETGVQGHQHVFNVDLRKRNQFVGVLIKGSDATAVQVEADVTFWADSTPDTRADVVVDG